MRLWQRTTRRLLVLSVFALTLLFYIVPVAGVQGLLQLQKLEQYAAVRYVHSAFQKARLFYAEYFKYLPSAYSILSRCSCVAQPMGIAAGTLGNLC